MPETIQYARPLCISEGWLCLDYVNIIGWLIEHGEQGQPFHPVHLLAWARRCNIITQEQTDVIRELTHTQSNHARELMQSATQLQQALNRLLSGESSSDADLDVFNNILTEAMTHSRLINKKGEYVWDWIDSESITRTRPLWPVARSASALLTSDELHRVGRCANDECGFLYLDISKNHSRRWCSMKTCGNVAKARRHYAKQRQETSK
jgi:predicted RNA-binding Zn ribbon-like protein